MGSRGWLWGLWVLVRVFGVDDVPAIVVVDVDVEVDGVVLEVAKCGGACLRRDCFTREPDEMGVDIVVVRV